MSIKNIEDLVFDWWFLIGCFPLCICLAARWGFGGREWVWVCMCSWALGTAGVFDQFTGQTAPTVRICVRVHTLVPAGKHWQYTGLNTDTDTRMPSAGYWAADIPRVTVVP